MRRRRLTRAVPALAGALLLVLPARARGQEEGPHRFQYWMRGRVRLLLFWVGRDDVGGGWIALHGAPVGSASPLRQVELVFGSRPERVPKGINRWGYARERVRRDCADRIQESAFLGFIRHSEEESLEQVSAGADAVSDGAFWYDGVETRVTRDGARSEVFLFSEEQDFDFREAASFLCGYRARRVSMEPSRVKDRHNRSGLYREPLGFLFAVARLLDTAIHGFTPGAGHPGDPTRARPSVEYVHHARPYTLSVTGIKRRPAFVLRPGPEDGGPDGPGALVSDVLEIDFRTRNHDSRKQHDFSLVVALRGPLRGVPLKIVDRPRWWLHVELYLVPDRGAPVLEAAPEAVCPCPGEPG